MSGTIGEVAWEPQADWSVRAEIVAWVDDEPPPGIVLCRFFDRNGTPCEFLGKYYDFSDEELGRDLSYPRPGLVRCLITERKHDDEGREVAIIDTISPHRGCESTDGASVFEVWVDQLAPPPMWQHSFAVPQAPSR